jgi:hypothetical protein
VPTLFVYAEGHIMSDASGEPRMNPAQSETPGMSGNSMRENRETPPASGSASPDRLAKATSHKASMPAGGESDGSVVPAKRPNKAEQSAAEAEEAIRPRGTPKKLPYRTQGRVPQD